MLHFSFTKKLTILFVILFGFYYALPNVLPVQLREALPSFMSQKTINLGLDLQGGSHMVIQVDLPAVIQRAYENLEETSARELNKDHKAELLRTESLDNKVVVYLKKSADIQQIKKVLGNEFSYLNLSEEEKEEGIRLTLKYTEMYLTSLAHNAVTQTLEILRMRVDEFGVSEPVIQRQGEDRIIVELPGIDDVERAKGIIGRTAHLSFHLVDDKRNARSYVNRRAPFGYKVAYEEMLDAQGRMIKNPILIRKRASLGGENLADAKSGFTQQSESAVFITFDTAGAREFGHLTTNNVGRRMAIVLDGVVMSAPVLREPILGGTASITGQFTPKEAQDLAMILRSGALPAPVRFAEERTIGPSLGQDSIAAGKIAVIVGFVGVMIMMLVFYRGFGVVANIALLCNLVLILGIMTALGATMTMPGIAGIVLTIGMAVDANVLIFERIKEEYLSSKRPRKALESGYASAYSTILDANITTLVAAVVLFSMGSGPIKGFALTLSVGILSSMFTAILVTRLILATWLHKAQPKTLKI